MAWHLAALCIALAVPILAVACLLILSEATAERTRIQEQMLSAADDITAAIDRDLASILATTQVLALSPYLQAGDLDSFDHQARMVYQILGMNVVLRDRDSQQLINTRVPRGTPLPHNSELESDKLVVETKRPVVSNLFTGAITSRPIFIVNVPVLRADQVVYFLNLTGEPNRVRDVVLQAIPLSSGWTGVVADRHGRVVAASSSREVGTQIPATILSQLKNRGSISEVADPVDPRRQASIASVRSPVSGWTIMVTVPDELVWSHLRHLVLGVGSTAAAVLVLSLGLAVAFSRRVEQSVAALAAQATSLGGGETVEPLSTPVREVNVLSAALSEASGRRRAVEAALRSSEERLQLAQSAGRIGTWDWDASTDELTCSETYRRLYGLDEQSPGHRNTDEWMAQVHPDDQARVKWIRKNALATGRLESEYRIVHPDGSIRWIVDRGMAFFDADGRLARVVGASVDVTESRDAAERARELQFELLHASRLSAMGQMAASLAHELNQPLGAAATFLGAARLTLAAGKPHAVARAAARIDKAAEQTMRAGAIVKRLRDFIRSGETDKRIADPRELIVEAVALALVGIKDDKLRIRYAFDPEGRSVLVDRIQMQQVLFNLIRNALEATERCHRREIVLATRNLGEGQVEISVADSGSGLPVDPEVLFKPFTTSKPEGMGIGLSICRTIVEAHDGRLWAESNPRGGAIFRFVVPAVTALEVSDVHQ